MQKSKIEAYNDWVEEMEKLKKQKPEFPSLQVNANLVVLLNDDDEVAIHHYDNIATDQKHLVGDDNIYINKNDAINLANFILELFEEPRIAK